MAGGWRKMNNELYVYSSFGCEVWPINDLFEPHSHLFNGHLVLLSISQ
jgi:hypothetical protein